MTVCKLSIINETHSFSAVKFSFSFPSSITAGIHVNNQMFLKGKDKGILFNVGGQTGKDCLLAWTDGVKVADRRDRTLNMEMKQETSKSKGHKC